MSLHGIVFYTLRAAAVALPVTALIWFLHRRSGRRHPREPLLLLFYFYLSCLIAITAIRGGEHLTDFWRIPHDGSTVQLVPIRVTLRQARAGAWAILYPVAGNIVWFLPYGLLRRLLWPKTGFLRIAAESLALSVTIEVLQWVLCSGISDIDDVIFNLTGGCLGRCAAGLFRLRKAE